VISLAGGPAASKPAASASVNHAGHTAALLDGIPQQGNVLGNPKAPVTLAEYGDLQCPYCAAWSQTALPTLVRDYVRDGRVRIEFRGLAFIGPESELGLRAALAAGNQGKLWHVVDLLYRNQGAENSGWLTEDTLRGLGESVPGLDSERMLRERDANGVASAFTAAQNAATASGIDSTPSFEVGRTGGQLKRVEISSLDADGLRPAIEAALAQ
jgi:protein-disulfide isomerase